MNYIFWLYLASRLDAIHAVFVIIFVGTLATTALFAFAYAISEECNPLPFLRPAKRYIITLLTVGAIGVALVPTKNDVMFIVGGAGVIEAAKAVAGSEVAKTSVSIIEKWLKEQEKELESKVKK